MRKIVIEAFQDATRPQGGHAVILLHGLENIPDPPTFRLRPLDTTQLTDPRTMWRNAKPFAPLTARMTNDGVEFVVGPDVVGHPMLVSGTPVVIELPGAGVRGEFLWPDVSPLAQARRRHLVVPRKPRTNDAATITLPPDLAIAELPPQPAKNDVNGHATHDELHNGHTNGQCSDAAAAMLEHHESPRDDAESVAPQPIIVPLVESSNSTPSQQDVSEAQSSTAVDINATGVTTSAQPDAHHPVNATPEIPRWTPGKEPPGNAGQYILHGAVSVGVLLAIAIFMFSGRNAQVPAPSPQRQLADRPASQQAARDSGSTSTATPAGKGTPATATVVAAPVMKPDTATCAAGLEVVTEALPAGRMKLALMARCHGGEEIKLSYGGAVFRRKLPADGSLDTVIDCFAGASQPLDIELADGTRRSVPIVALDLDRVTKVAVIWQAPVNLDLHAFEYAALFGGTGHKWSGSPGSLAQAQAARSDRRGHGYLSASEKGDGPGDKLEVYTFFHDESQTTGAVTLALDYASRGETASGAACGTGPFAEIPYKVSVLRRGTLSKVENGIIAAAECGARLAPEARFGQSVLPVLSARK